MCIIGKHRQKIVTFASLFLHMTTNFSTTIALTTFIILSAIFINILYYWLSVRVISLEQQNIFPYFWFHLTPYYIDINLLPYLIFTLKTLFLDMKYILLEVLESQFHLISFFFSTFYHYIQFSNNLL